MSIATYRPLYLLLFLRIQNWPCQVMFLEKGEYKMEQMRMVVSYPNAHFQRHSVQVCPASTCGAASTPQKAPLNHISTLAPESIQTIPLDLVLQRHVNSNQIAVPQPVVGALEFASAANNAAVMEASTGDLLGAYGVLRHLGAREACPRGDASA